MHIFHLFFDIIKFLTKCALLSVNVLLYFINHYFYFVLIVCYLDDIVVQAKDTFDRETVFYRFKDLRIVQSKILDEGGGTRDASDKCLVVVIASINGKRYQNYKVNGIIKAT